MKRAEILEAARVCVCGEREQDYGSPEDSFGLIAQLRTALWTWPVMRPVPVRLPPLRDEKGGFDL